MDFIKKLSSSSSFDTILVIVDQLSKQAIFIPTHDTITSVELACLFITHVFAKHRVLSHVMSDRSSKFVSYFFCSLGTALDMRLYFTSEYHLETNGQAEQTNQMLEQYLCIYCNYQQNNWSEPWLSLHITMLLVLPLVSLHSSPTKSTNPNLIVYPEQDIASSHACDFIVDLDELQSILKEEIAKAQRQYQPSC